MTPQPRSRFRIPHTPAAVLAGALFAAAVLLRDVALAAPKVIVISLDGATPRFVDQYLATGALGPNEGLGLLRRVGIHAKQNVTISPSLTAAGHIAIATGSTAAHNDVVANTFHLVASPFTSNISGFAAPVGGYSIDGPAESPIVTAELVWIALRRPAGKVAAATFPGADGLDIRIPGLANSPIVQRAAERTVDYTVPFGAFAGIGAQGFSLVAADSRPRPPSTVKQLGRRAGRPVQSRAAEDDAARDLHRGRRRATTSAWPPSTRRTTRAVNYDTLVFFDARQGILPGPFASRPPAPPTCAPPTSAPRPSTSRAAAARRASAST